MTAIGIYNVYIYIYVIHIYNNSLYYWCFHLLDENILKGDQKNKNVYFKAREMAQ